MKKYAAVLVLLTLSGLGFRLFLALRLPNDEPDDGRVYARIAINALEHRTYSIETEEPYSPTLIRVPGYPLFIAGIYALFGHENNRAVRVVQALLDTITCWLIALLALVWAPDSWPPKKRRRLFLIALGLAVTCPFPAIYVTTILTETCTILLATACALTATLAMKNSGSKAMGWCAAAGVFGGLATLFRPDSGMFVAAVGVTLAVIGLRGAISRSRAKRLSAARAFALGAALSLGFVLTLTPWTIRNARLFGVFQPIAPQFANMPGDFVPRGYIQWLRTWVDDVKYTESLEFPLDIEQIHIDRVPSYAFDSPEERERVAALLDRYNNPPSKAGAQNIAQPDPPVPDPKGQSPTSTPQQQSSTDTAVEDQEQVDEPDSQDEESDSSDVKPEAQQPGEMTPEIDAGFDEIARERIGRHPLRYYLIVPLKRAASMWFDTHSQYYPFQGEMLPLSELDTDIHQQYWLPFFMFLTVFYTGLAVGGAWLMWRDKGSRGWLLLFALLILPRLAFLTSMENPEPRYVVEFFAFVVTACSLAMIASWDWLAQRRKGQKERHD
jgi:hypothetical protein